MSFLPPALQRPDGFECIRRGRDTILVRRDVRDELGRLLPLFLDLRQIPGAHVLPGGRGITLSAPVRENLRAVLRRNLRGGLPARFVRDLYLGWGARPLVEIEVTERLREAGVPVPESLGAIVRRVGVISYRGAVAVREIEGSTNLWVYLQSATEPLGRRRICEAALDVVQRLHAAGALHPDLNLQNFLVQNDGGATPRVWLIDCDGVRFATVSEADRRAALERIQRSCRKLDPAGAVVDPKWFDA